MLEKNYDLSCWYINVRRVMELLGPKAIEAPTMSPEVFLYKPALFANIKDAIVTRILANKLPTIGQLAIENKVEVGTLVTHTGGTFCLGLSDYVAAQESGSQSQDLPRIYAKFGEESHYERFESAYHPEHLTSQSSYAHLKGKANLFLLGVIDSIEGKTIQVKPYIIGSVVLNIFDRIHPLVWGQRFEVTVDEIDSFSKVSTQPHPKKSELLKLKEVPEDATKKAFAEILGEPIVSKDWGGERSDLTSDRLVLEGKRISTAFAFKGPAKFHPMKMTDLGKNGDQIDRLFSEPADLLVLQHCHEITGPVRAAMRAYARNITNPRQCCVIDGFDTLRILRAYKPELVP